MLHSGGKGWMSRAKPQKSLKARRFSSSATGAAFHLVLSLSSDRADCRVRKAPLPKGIALMLPLQPSTASSLPRPLQSVLELTHL